MNKAVDSFTAKGETPIAYSMGKAVDDLGSSGKRVLVLISDGEETCADDPCPVAKKLADRGVDLQFNAIGLDVGAKARKQLRCIADAGDGSYYDANQSGELSEALRRITQRALRPFQITGTPVKGAKARGDAPALTAGQYQDRYDTSDTKRYYRIDRATGSTVTVSATSLVQPWHSQTADRWSLQLATVDGKQCDVGGIGSTTYHSVTVITSTVRSSVPTAGGACDAGPLLLSLSRSNAFGDKRTAPVEVVVSEEPAISNLASLPKPVTSYLGHAKAVPASMPVRPATGGTAFSNAAELTPGSWSETVTIGETLFYKVHLETGQRLRATLQAPAPKGSVPLSGAETVSPTVRLFSASRTELASDFAVLQNGRHRSVTLATPEVRVRNRERPVTGLYDRIGNAAAAGDYYVAVLVDALQGSLNGRIVPVRLKLAVDGEPEGQPQYAAAASPTPSPSVSPSSSASLHPSPGASSTPATTTNDGGSPLLVPVLGAVIALGVLGGAAALLLRRRSARSRRSPR